MPWELTGNRGIDPTKNFLGTTDNEPLIIKTSGAEQLRIDIRGNIGIGTDRPAAKLDVRGQASVQGPLSINHAGVTGVGSPGDTRSAITFGATDTPAAFYFGTYDANTTKANTILGLYSYQFGNWLQFWSPNGNVGIGTTTPTNALHVNSNTGIRQNRLCLSGGDGWSSLTYNAYHNGANNAWIFPDSSHKSVTIEMDDAQGVPRFEIFSTTSNAPTNWVKRFAINGDSGNVSMAQSGGNVGIGTDAPAWLLHVVGRTRSNDTTYNQLIVFSATDGDIGSLYHRSNGTTSILGIESFNAGNTAKTPLALQEYGGNVGIGTSNPLSTLSVNGTMRVSATYTRRDGSQLTSNMSTNLPSSSWDVSATVPGEIGPILSLSNYGGVQGTAVAIDFYTFDPGQPHDPDEGNSGSSRIMAIDDGNHGNDIVFLSTTGSAWGERMRITSAGNVTVPGDILLTGADCAEQFDVGSSELPEPGTIVVIEEGGTLRESRVAYDKKVAGVVSGAGDFRHAILLDKQPESQHRVAVALAGKAYCKVDARYAPVKVGDLLTTSPTPGHAMKADDPLKAFGAVLGKALQELPGGQGLVPILVALQ